MRFRYLLLGLVLGVLIFGSAHQASALEYAVVPSKLEYKVKSGDSSSNQVKVYNRGTEPLSIKIYVEDYSINQQNQFTFFKPGKTSYSAAKWIQINRKKFAVQPGDHEIVTLTVVTPRKAEGGGHYAIVFFESVNPVEQKKDSIIIKHRGRIGAVVLTTVTGAGPVYRKGILDGVKEDVSWGKFIERWWPPKLNFANLFQPKVMVTAVFKNNGNTYIHVGGRTNFTSGWFNTSQKENLSPITALPNTKRNLEVEWKNPPFIGPCNAQSKVVYQVSQTSGKALEGRVPFWIIPWNLLILLLIIGIAIWLTAKLIAKGLTKLWYKARGKVQDPKDTDKSEDQRQ